MTASSYAGENGRDRDRHQGNREQARVTVASTQLSWRSRLTTDSLCKSSMTRSETSRGRLLPVKVE